MDLIETLEKYPQILPEVYKIFLKILEANSKSDSEPTEEERIMMKIISDKICEKTGDCPF